MTKIDSNYGLYALRVDGGFEPYFYDFIYLYHASREVLVAISKEMEDDLGNGSRFEKRWGFWPDLCSFNVVPIVAGEPVSTSPTSHLFKTIAEYEAIS